MGKIFYRVLEIVNRAKHVHIIFVLTHLTRQRKDTIETKDYKTKIKHIRIRYNFFFIC